MAYVGGKETQYTRDILPEIKEAIGFSEYLATRQRAAPATVVATTQPFPPPAPAKAPLRILHDSTGKFTVEASLSAIKEKVVVLTKRDGTSIEVPLERLSTADREFVKRDPFLLK